LRTRVGTGSLCWTVSSRRYVLALLLAALALLALAAAAAAKPAAVHKSLHVSGLEAQRTVQFWTARRMRHARPLSVVLEGRPARRALHHVLPPSGAPHLVPALNAAPPRKGPKSDEPISTVIADPTAAPYRTSGRVFAVVGQYLVYCSATVVNTANKSVVFTAGHCVNSGGPSPTWYGRHWAFIPGYHDGQRPFGTFVARELWSSTPWAQSENYDYDFAAAVLGRNSRGQRVAAAVGGRGFASGQSRNQVFEALGYPATEAFNGESLWGCNSPFLRDDPEPIAGGPAALGINCDMTAGSSGGGWIVGGQNLNSVTSFGYDGLPDVLFGPYFGQAAWKLYSNVGKR
jgi:V8-like Glu-specific endopeptidase